MSDVVIKVEQLSKQYRLGTINHGVLYRDVQSWWARVRGKEDPNSLITLGQQGSSSSDINDHFWALRDVSFEVKQGEVLGVIGKNGAGKSTLLKILSKVTAPTSGAVKIKGHVASLLEVGTGFHPELTGRENIFLNGAILGMSRSEISMKFDEIVAFAEVEKFIDTPVKRYSSGMYVRLAFAVAAHLQPEILIIDEVLAVGDVQFQKKCLGKMEEVGNEGRTVLFVSHNMGAIQQLCSRAVLLDAGRVSLIDSAYECVNAYISGVESMGDMDLSMSPNRVGNGCMTFEKVLVIDAEMQTKGFVKAGNTAIFEFKIKVTSMTDHAEDLVVRFSILDSQSHCIAHCSNLISGENITASKDKFIVSCVVDKLPLNKGYYSFSAYIGTINETFDYIANIASFHVESGDFYSTGRLPEMSHSTTLLNYKWNQC